MSSKILIDEKKAEFLCTLLSPYLEEACILFKEKRQYTDTSLGAWQELMYCILAGTQVPIESARKSFDSIKQQMGNENTSTKYLVNTFTAKEMAEKFSSILKGSGYRYYRTKAAVLANAAIFIQSNLKGDLRNILKYKDIAKQINALTKNINGIGIKIANHWLRNMGQDTCTIDLHLKRIFLAIGIYEGNPEKAISQAEFQRLIKVIRLLSDRLHKPLVEVQYALWKAARELPRSEYLKISKKFGKDNHINIQEELFDI